MNYPDPNQPTPSVTSSGFSSVSIDPPLPGVEFPQGARLTPEHPAMQPPGVVRLPDGTYVTAAAQQPKRRAWNFFWWTFFLGNLGIGRFYMGHIGLGVAYLLTLGFFFVGPIVDCIRCRAVTRKENEARGYGPVWR